MLFLLVDAVLHGETPDREEILTRLGKDRVDQCSGGEHHWRQGSGRVAPKKKTGVTLSRPRLDMPYGGAARPSRILPQRVWPAIGSVRCHINPIAAAAHGRYGFRGVGDGSHISLLGRT